MRGIVEVPSLSVELFFVGHLVIYTRPIVGGFIMLEERGFRQGRVFTAVFLRSIVGSIVCGGAVLVGGMTWHALMTGNIINHADNVLGDGFVGDG